MTTSNEPHREHPSTYFVQDRSNEEELNRLRIQDQMITAAMGGVLPEQPDVGSFRRILDVGSGSGNWALETARTYPDIRVFGIDISKRMVDYARAQTVEQSVADRVEFAVMDALRMLEFPAGFFDLVNLRMGNSFLRKWDWPKMLSELQRVTRLGGVVRVTENEIIHESTSQASLQWNEMLQCALHRAGNFFEAEPDGITSHLVPLFKQHGVQQVQMKSYALEYRAGTPQIQAFYEDAQHLFHTTRPFIQKWGCISQDYNAITQQALQDIQANDFHSIWNFLTVWGRRL